MNNWGSIIHVFHFVETFAKHVKSHFFFGTGIDLKQNCQDCKMKKTQKPKGGEKLQFFIFLFGLGKVENFH